MYVFWCVWSACACFDKAVVKSSTFAGSVETRQRWPTPLTLPELYKVTVGRPIAHCFSVKLKWKLDPPFLLWNNKKRKRCCVSEALMKITHVLSAGKTQGGTLLRSIVYLTLSLRQSWAHGCLSNSSLWRVQCHSVLNTVMFLCYTFRDVWVEGPFLLGASAVELWLTLESHFN